MVLEENRPVLIEAMTYRIGHHSTSDDSTAYRSVDEVRYWDEKDHPISRLRHYMVKLNWWNDDAEKAWKDESKKQIMQSFARAETHKKPSPELLFTDVYDELLPHIEEQMEEMKRHVTQHADHYPLKSFEDMTPPKPE